MFITSIERGASISGNAGCTNGNYDIPVKIRFDTGTVAMAHTCRCGNGCNGSFPANWCKLGLEFESIRDFWAWINEEEGVGPINYPEICRLERQEQGEWEWTDALPWDVYGRFCRLKMRGRDILHVIRARETVENSRRDAIHRIILWMNY